MSVDAAKLYRSFGLSQSIKPKVNCLDRKSKSFNQVMDTTAKKLKSNENSQVQTIEFVKLAQLRMLQGLFAVEEAKDPFKFINSINLQSLALYGSQNVDKYRPEPQVEEVSVVSDGKTTVKQMIARVAEKTNLSPDLIHSVVAAESAYDSAAVSPAGAQGLMQLMPDTAQELGVQDSFDPLQNLLGGSKYLKQLLDKYSGDLDSALAAYNWGQGNVDRRGLDQMPKETRDYLARVKNGLAKNV